MRMMAHENLPNKWHMQNIILTQKISLVVVAIMVHVLFLHSRVHFPLLIYTRSTNSVPLPLTSSCHRKVFCTLLHNCNMCVCTVHTVLQNRLQISTSKKCLKIWYLCGTEVSQTIHLVCIPHDTWNGRCSLQYRISIKCFLPQE